MCESRHRKRESDRSLETSFAKSRKEATNHVGVTSQPELTKPRNNSSTGHEGQICSSAHGHLVAKTLMTLLVLRSVTSYSTSSPEKPHV